MFGGVMAYAQETGVTADSETEVKTEASVSTTNTTKETPKPAPSLLQRLRAGLGVRKEIKEVRTEAKVEVKNIKTQTKEAVRDVRATAASSSIEKRGAIKDIRVQAKEDIKDVRANLASSTKGIRVEAKKERVSNIFDRTVSRLEATIVREETIMAKIIARIGIIKAAGGNTADAEKFVAEAKVSFTNARVALGTLKALVATGNVGVAGTASTSAQVMNDTMSKMRKAGAEVEKNIRAGHNALVRAVVSLIKLPQNRPNASTTTNVNVEGSAEVNSQN